MAKTGDCDCGRIIGVTDLREPRIYLMSHNCEGIVSYKRYIVNKISSTKFSEEIPFNKMRESQARACGVLMSTTVGNQRRILAHFVALC